MVAGGWMGLCLGAGADKTCWWMLHEEKRELREWVPSPLTPQKRKRIPGLVLSNKEDMVPSMEMGAKRSRSNKKFCLSILVLRGPLGTSKSCYIGSQSKFGVQGRGQTNMGASSI